MLYFWTRSIHLFFYSKYHTVICSHNWSFWERWTEVNLPLRESWSTQLPAMTKWPISVLPNVVATKPHMAFKHLKYGYSVARNWLSNFTYFYLILSSHLWQTSSSLGLDRSWVLHHYMGPVCQLFEYFLHPSHLLEETVVILDTLLFLEYLIYRSQEE